MGNFISLAIAMSMVAPALAQAKDKPPISLPKNGKWEINYDDDSCHLMAKFGEGQAAAIIRMTRYQPSDGFDLSIYGEPFKGGNSTMQVKIGFGIVPPVKREAILGSSGNKLPLLLLTSERLDGWQRAQPDQVAPPISQTLEAKARVIDLTVAGGKRYRLETGSFGAPMGAMRVCLSDLVKKWGYDPVQQAMLRAPAMPTKSPGAWLGSSDYPREALYNGYNGLVQFRLDISESGAVTGCNILHRTNPDEFADLSCKLLAKRAKFTPARDKDGKPVKSYFISKIRFVIPE